MIGVNTFYGQYGNVIKRRRLPYKGKGAKEKTAVDCFQDLCNNRTGSYTCDVSVDPDGEAYDFGIDGERKQFCNDNGVASSRKEIFVLAITHNTTSRLTDENRWGYNKIKNDDELARLKTNYPLFGRFEDLKMQICLDTCYVIKERKKALKALGKGNLNYYGNQIWQESMVCMRIPRIDSEPFDLYFTEVPDDDDDGTPIVIYTLKDNVQREITKINRETLERHAID